jgi:inhibitor of KinA
MSESARAPVLSWSSERTLRIALGDAIGDAAHSRVRSGLEALKRANIPGVIDVIPAHTTLLVECYPLALDFATIESTVGSVLKDAAAAAAPAAREVIIPVCYDADHAPDLADVAAMHAITPDRVVALHVGASYTVQFVGFSPGFGYLAGLPAELETPRLDRPRPRVPPGSVGIAGLQTGVYPRATPGGWRLIGRTPLRMFDAARDEPSTLTIGDQVRFTPVSRAEFASLAAEQP